MRKGQAYLGPVLILLILLLIFAVLATQVVRVRPSPIVDEAFWLWEDQKATATHVGSKVEAHVVIRATGEYVGRTLGRARLYAQKMLPEIRSSKRDFKSQIEEIIHSLEAKHEADLGDFKGVFKPLTALNIIEITNGKAVLNSEFDFIIKLLAEFYYNLINEPELVKLVYPTEKEVIASEKEQMQAQIKLALDKMWE